MPTPNHLYRYSYSGADATVFAYYEGYESLITKIEAAHTISFSIHEAKGDARSFGFRGVKGRARGIRTVAGSIILTVIEDHPLRPLMDQLQDAAIANDLLRYSGWSIDQNENGTGAWAQTPDSRFSFSNRLSALLPRSNWVVNYMSEASNYTTEGTPGVGEIFNLPGAALLIRGVEFIDEGMVTSVNDMVTEVTYSFKAYDVKPIAPTLMRSHGVDMLADILKASVAPGQAQLQQMLFKKQALEDAWADISTGGK